MPTYLLCHRHAPQECGVAFAAWRGFDSVLRGGAALCACTTGDHRIWWTLDAPDPSGALALLPPFLAHRTTVARVSSVRIP